LPVLVGGKGLRRKGFVGGLARSLAHGTPMNAEAKIVAASFGQLV